MLSANKMLRSTKEIVDGVVTITIPVKTTNQRNASRQGSWKKAAGQSKMQKRAVAEALFALQPPRPSMPLAVTLIRISPGRCDSDGAIAALKWVRDAFAEWVGVDDGKEGPDGYDWRYGPHEKMGDYGVRIRYTADV